MISKKNRIGIDIECIAPRIEKLSKKFLSEQEDSSAYGSKRMEKLHVMWGAKEVLFKIHSIGNLIFKKDIFVYSFDYSGSGEIKASILKEGFEKDYSVQYLKTGKYMLTWSVEMG